MRDFYNSAPVVFCSIPRTLASLAFLRSYTCWDELEGNPFKSWKQYPWREKKSFSLGRVRGEGGVTPLVAVESEGNMENLILWRQPEEEDVWGLDLFLWEHRGPE